MKILLVNNISLDMEKFIEQNKLLLESAKENNINLDIKTNMEIYAILSSNGEYIKNNLNYDAVMFYDKDIILASILEDLGYPVFNNSKCIELCDNKALMYKELAKHNIPIPKTLILPLTFYYKKEYYNNYVDNAIKELSLPLIVKEWFGSWGKQVYLCSNKEEILNIIEKTQGKQLLFQEYIEESKGKDIRINIVGEKIVASMKRVASDNSFQANISNGVKMFNYTPTKEEQDLSLRVSKALDCDFCGVDLLFGKNGPIVCEVNSNAHLLNIYECTKVNVAEDILNYIKQKMKK